MQLSTRETLIEQAAQLLDDGGVEAVTLRETAARSGVSHNAPYRHFSDKRALLAAVAERELVRQRVFSDDIDECDPEQALRAVVERYLTWALRYPRRFRLVFQRWPEEPDELTDAARNLRNQLVGIVARAQSAGLLPEGSPEHMALMLWSLAHGAVDLHLAGHLVAQVGGAPVRPGDLVDAYLTLLAPRMEASP